MSRLVSLFALAFMLGLSTSCAHTPPPTSIQAQCGVAPDALVTQSQATCIATLAGFAPGLLPWVVREEPYPAMHRIEWLVFNTLNTEPCVVTPGEVMHINKAGGAVLITVPWAQVCDTYPTERPRAEPH